ncbi:NAD(P)H-binding protein [Brevibacterium sp. FAM 24638]|uniref:NAD(P)H-binding protein n=1 Tax=Brevibacterium sp. FAM 24638 TaxID=3415681 RepID=UPI003C7C3175
MSTVAVTGASGAIGSRVVSELAAGGTDVLAIVRRPGSAPAGPGICERAAHYDDPDSLTGAFYGAQSLVFIGSDGEADRMLMHHHHILTAAMSNGIARIVFLSSQDADPSSPFCYAHPYAVTESWLHTSGAHTIIVRAGLYSEFLGRWVKSAAHEGSLRLPMSSGQVAPVARADVARALVAAVDSQEQSTYVVTGPRAYGLGGLARAAAKLTGTVVDSMPCHPGEFAAILAEREPSAWWRYAYSTMFDAIALGRFAAVTDDLRRLTGSAGIDLDEVLGSGGDNGF